MNSFQNFHNFSNISHIFLKIIISHILNLLLTTVSHHLNYIHFSHTFERFDSFINNYYYQAMQCYMGRPWTIFASMIFRQPEITFRICRLGLLNSFGKSVVLNGNHLQISNHWSGPYPSQVRIFDLTKLPKNYRTE